MSAGALVLAVCVIKGGTGKSTTAAALAQAAAADGKRVLAVDLDAQGNLTDRLDGRKDAGGVVDLLHGTPAAAVIQSTGQGVDLIAGTTDTAAEQTGEGSGHRLRKALAPVLAGYDLAIIDTPPAIGESTLNAILAADMILAPLEADGGSLSGLYQITEDRKSTRLNSSHSS